MYSRSFDFNSRNQFSVNQVSNFGYNSDPVSFPTMSPYQFSYNQISPYSYQSRGETFQKPFPYQPKQQYKNSPQSKLVQNKKFIDAFDNNSSGLFNQNKSFARNIKGRLLNNQDPFTQKVKQDKASVYRQQLQRQIEQTRKRKQQQKQKIEKEELERERKFYQQFKIKAQVKQNKGDQKQQNNFYMGRTLHKLKKSKDDHNLSSKDEASPTLKPVVIKARGKSYLNKSSLDNFEATYPDTAAKQEYLQKEQGGQKPTNQKKENRLSRIQQEIIKQKYNQQERLSKLLLFQQRVLQKINDIKVQIRNTSFNMDGEKQLQKIRNSLRSKPIPFDEQFTLNPIKKSNFDMSPFYSLPKRQVRTRPPTQYSVKLKDSRNISSPQKVVKSQKSEIINDKNISTKQQQQQREQNQEAVE